MTQEHCFKAAELALRAQEFADRQKVISALPTPSR